MTTNQQKLSKIVKTIIKEEIDFIKLKKAIDDLNILFEEVSKIDTQKSSNKEHLYLKTGKAIGPKWAGMCVNDIMRTKRFITGVYKAIKTKQQKKKNTPVCILYAGTGPYATLVMPLITLFQPNELQLILLEVNPNTIESLNNTIAALQADNYIKEIHQCDAATFSISQNSQVDIVLIECLQHALRKEPQVAITYNLLSQLDKDVILIPEQISLQISLIDTAKKYNNSLDTSNTNRFDFYKTLETIFVLNKEEVLKNPSLVFPKVKVMLSEENIEKYNLLAITTDLIIFNEEKLTIDDSGLTIPFILSDLNNQKLKGIETQYIINEHPEIETTFIK